MMVTKPWKKGIKYQYKYHTELFSAKKKNEAQNKLYIIRFWWKVLVISTFKQKPYKSEAEHRYIFWIMSL